MKGLRLALSLPAQPVLSALLALLLAPPPAVAEGAGDPPARPTPLVGLPGPAGAGLGPAAPEPLSRRTNGEVGREIGRFLAEEVAPVRQRITWEGAARGASPPIRPPDGQFDAGYVPGTNVLFLPPVPWGSDLGPVGAAIYLGLSVGLSALTEKEWTAVRRCGELLDGRSAALSAWWETCRGPDGERAPADVDAEAKRRMTEIRSLPECRGQFRSPAPPPLRIPGPLP